MKPVARDRPLVENQAEVNLVKALNNKTYAVAFRISPTVGPICVIPKMFLSSA